MNNRNSVQELLIKPMHRAFFDVTSDDVLIYVDPWIGSLASRETGLTVKLNREKTRLELQVGDRVERIYDLAENVAAACIAATGGYFDAFVRLRRMNDVSAVATR